MKKPSLLILLIFTFFQTPAQIHSQLLYWTRYQLTVNFSPAVYWTSEADNRRFIDPDVENQLIFHSRLHYLKGPWDFAGGLTLSYAFSQKPEDGYERVVAEIRPVAEVSHELRLKGITLMNRFRIDNRFFEVSESESIWENSRYVFRWRYRLQARIPLKMNEQRQVIGLRVADEIMFNHTENFFDQNRIYCTADFGLNKKFTLEAGYIYIYQRRFGMEEFFSRHVMRTSLLHKIGWKD
jgi:hypothetical protein